MAVVAGAAAAAAAATLRSLRAVTATAAKAHVVSRTALRARRPSTLTAIKMMGPRLFFATRTASPSSRDLAGRSLRAMQAFRSWDIAMEGWDGWVGQRVDGCGGGWVGGWMNG